jgi:hypothetical protein
MNISSPNADEVGEAGQADVRAFEALVSRRMAMGGVAFFGGAMAAISSRAFAQPGAPGSYSNSAIVAEPPGEASGNSDDDIVRAVKIGRAMRSGPRRITRDATVAEMDHHGSVARVLRKGTNGWVCIPGDDNRIGAPPMCVDELGMQWFKDAMTGQPRPTNRAPGLRYLLCGATQHSNTDIPDSLAA